MTSKQVCQLDENGYFIFETTADESPLEKGVFHIPFNAVDIEPPNVEQGFRYKFLNGSWVSEEIPLVQQETQPEIAMTYKELRAGEYPDIGDQLDSLFHAGVFPEEMALKIQAVKYKYPKS